MTHDHDHTDDIAREVFKQITNIMEFKNNHAEKLFINGDVPTTQAFWLLLESKYPNTYDGVDYCPACKKFTLFLTKS